MKKRNQQADIIELPRFLGENNRLPDSELRSQDGVYVRQAVNVDLTNRGTFERRDGYARIIESIRASSLYSNSDRCFYLDNGTLYELKLNSEQNLEKVALKTGFRLEAKLTYCTTPLGVYFSDGETLYRIAGNRVVTVTTVRAQPPILKTTEGSLKPGRYMFAVTWVDENGTESPPSHYEMIELGEPMGIEVLASPPSGFSYNVYASPLNSSTMYLQTTSKFTAIIRNNSKQIGSSTDRSLPAGELLAYANGRLLSAKGQYLYYSEPFNLEECDLVSGYISFAEPITVLMATENGIYVAADKTWFLEGRSITELTFKEVLPYGGVFGTACRGKDGEYCWMSPFGFVKANSLGEVENVQVGKVGVVPCTRGNSIFIKEHGKEKFVTTVEKQKDAENTFANKDYATSETNRKESQP